MTNESQLAKKQWDSLLTSVQQLCRIYWGPSEELSLQMMENSFVRPFNAVVALIDTNTDTDIVALHRLLKSFSGGASLLAYLEEGYVRLFVNDRGGVAAPLYASCYENEDHPQLMGAPAARMQRLMADLKVHIGDDVHEPPDHLAIELEVLYFLLIQETTTDRPAGLTTAADFVAGEMLPWVTMFHRRMAGEAQCRFYPLITSVLLSVLGAIVTLSGSKVGHAS